MLMLAIKQVQEAGDADPQQGLDEQPDAADLIVVIVCFGQSLWIVCSNLYGVC